VKKWEDIVKDKMEEFDEALPESVFDEFHAIRNGSAPASKRKRFPLVWALVPAVTAGLAAVFFLRHPSTPDNGTQVIRQPAYLITAINDSTEVVEPIQAKPLIVQASTSIISKKPSDRPQKPETFENPEHLEEAVTPNPAENVSSPVTEGITTTETKEETTIDGSVVTTASPFIADNIGNKSVKMKVVPALGAIAGGGLLACIATPVLESGLFKTQDTVPVIYEDYQYAGLFSTPDMTNDDSLIEYRHSFPFRGGLSVGIPVAERWKMTTGLEYSRYQSKFTYSLSGEKKQIAHYLGIPIRLDWTLADNGWLDVYLGGGIEGDICLGATLGGEKITRDGIGFSLIGAGGIQFNITEHLGLYVEPELSWTLPSESHVLANYRSDHPFMFSIASGLRINLGI